MERQWTGTIEELIPHRTPFFFVSAIDELVPGERAQGHWELVGRRGLLRRTLPRAADGARGADGRVARPARCGGCSRRPAVLGSAAAVRRNRQGALSPPGRPRRDARARGHARPALAIAPARVTASPRSAASSPARRACSSCSSRAERDARRHLEHQLVEGPARLGSRRGSRQRRRTCSLLAGDQAHRRRLPARWPSRRSATRPSTTATVAGTASRSSRASESKTSASAFPTADADVGEECRIISAGCGGVRVYSRLRARTAARSDRRSYDAKLEWLGELRVELDATLRPDDDVADRRRLQRRARGPRRLGHHEVRRGDPRHARGARRASAASSAFGLIDVVRELHPGETGPLLVVGLPRRRVPQGRGDAHRPRPRLGVARREGERRLRRPRGAQERASSPRPPSDHAPVVVDFDR